MYEEPETKNTPDSSGLKKVSLALNQKSVKNVEYISAVIGESNKTRVIAIALKCARVILEHRNKGHQIIFKDENDNESQMQINIS
jgi:hypothetical protein